MTDEHERLPERLGARLKLAREGTGLTLSELAQRTHVRRAYLEALEEGDYDHLPEDVYARNFVRLYGQSLGLEPAPLLEAYQRERRAAIGVTTLDQRLERDRRAIVGGPPAAAPLRPPRGLRRGPALPSWLFGPWLATLALVVVVVGLAAWGLDRLLAPGAGLASSPTNGATSAADGAALPPPGVGSGAATTVDPPPGPVVAGDAVVRFEVVTEPPGAAVTIDGFPLPGRTPLVGVPVSARAGRVVRIELDGYEPSESTVDLTVDGRVDVVLTPVATTVAAPGTDVGRGRVALTVSDTTWLEVYRSSARNEGERLVYTTAQPGTSYEFAMPVYVYVGNAAGVRVNLAGQDLGPMGAPGAVLGRAFGP